MTHDLNTYECYTRFEFLDGDEAKQNIIMVVQVGETPEEASRVVIETWAKMPGAKLLEIRVFPYGRAVVTYHHQAPRS